MRRSSVAPTSRFIARAFLAAAALMACGLGCRPTSSVPILHGDALLLASDREVLDQRLALVGAGRYDEAHVLWAERALLPPPATALESTEMVWHRQIASALGIHALQGPKPMALDRVARAFDRAHWFRECRVVLEREKALEPLSPDSQALLAVATNLDRFAAAADSAARSRYAAIERTKVRPGSEVPVGELMARFGINQGALSARGLHLGQRHLPARPEVTELELAVVVDHEGPFVIHQGDEDVHARRIVLDDHLITPYPGVPAASPWLPGSTAVVEEGTLCIYHDRSALRRAATLLYLELERRGGRPPEIPPLPQAPADSLPAGESVALAVRLRSVSLLFAESRASGGLRDEMLRRFAVDLIAARVAQIEAGEAKRLIEERAHPGTTGGVRGAEARLVGALRYGPLPELRLADALDEAAHAGPDSLPSPATEAARETLIRLRRQLAAGGDAADAGLASLDRLLRLDPERLRTLAAAIDAERFAAE